MVYRVQAVCRSACSCKSEGQSQVRTNSLVRRHLKLFQLALRLLLSSPELVTRTSSCKMQCAHYRVRKAGIGQDGGTFRTETIV